MHTERDDFTELACATYAEVAAAMGVSRARVQQIEATAIRKYRLALRIEELAPARSREILARLRGQPVYAFEATVLQLKRECSGALSGALSGAIAGAYAGAHPLNPRTGRRDAECRMVGGGELSAVPES